MSQFEGYRPGARLQGSRTYPLAAVDTLASKAAGTSATLFPVVTAKAGHVARLHKSTPCSWPTRQFSAFPRAQRLSAARNSVVLQ